MATDPDLLKKISCFQGLSDEQIKDIAQIAVSVCYPPHHNIFEEGVMGKRLYFLLKGKVEILFNTGKPTLTQIDLKEGEHIMGCSAMMEPYMYTATNRSLTEVEVLEINISQLQELMKKDCQIGLAIQSQLIKFMKEYILRLRNILSER